MTEDTQDALPLFLTRQEMKVLLTAVEVCLRLDGSVLTDTELQKTAEKQILANEGVAGVARADRALAAAKMRLPVLHRLHSMLSEHLAQFPGTPE